MDEVVLPSSHIILSLNRTPGAEIRLYACQPPAYAMAMLHITPKPHNHHQM
jgi:hypothetical protein